MLYNEENNEHGESVWIRAFDNAFCLCIICLPLDLASPVQNTHMYVYGYIYIVCHMMISMGRRNDAPYRWHAIHRYLHAIQTQ